MKRSPEKHAQHCPVFGDVLDMVLPCALLGKKPQASYGQLSNGLVDCESMDG